MKKFAVLGCMLTSALFATPQEELNLFYQHFCTQTSDINQHIPVLRELAKECDSVMELGLRYMNSTWGIIKGLSESPYSKKKYFGIDLVTPPANIIGTIAFLAKAHDIEFYFYQANDFNIKASNLPLVDMLFIDTLHTYCHLTYELENFSCIAKKYITMHDTSEPWGDRDDTEYHGDFSEYPKHFDRTKRGLWPAVEDFLKNHPEWVLLERRFNNHGFTILKRIS